MAKKSSKNNQGLLAPEKLKVLVTIVERNKAQFYADILEGYDVNLQTIIYGRGTLPNELKKYLNSFDQQKAVLLSIVNESRVKEILAAYEDKYFKVKHGKGIAFTFPISSVIGVMIYKFLTNKGEL